MQNQAAIEGACTVGRALERIGDAWSMLILREAGYGSTRFEQFRTTLAIAPNILTRRLTAMTAAGLFEKRRYQDRPARYEYVLSPKGRDFLPALAAIGAWGRRHYGGGTTSHLVDAVSGRRIEPIVVDRATGQPLTDLNLRLALSVGEGTLSDTDL